MNNTPTFTSGPEWTNRFLAGLRIVHARSGMSPGWGFKEPLTPERALEILSQIQLGKYSPSQHLAPSAGSQAAVAGEVPEIKDAESYVVFTLNARSPRSAMISVTTGGIVFEDPFWAVLACHAASLESPRAIPAGATNEAIWMATKSAAADLSKPDADFGKYLKTVSGFTEAAPHGEVRLANIKGDKLAALRQRGMQSITLYERIQFFELFDRP